LIVSALAGIGAVMAGLLLLLDPGVPAVIGPAGDTTAVKPRDVAPPGDASAESTVTTMAKSVPTRVRIPKIRVNAPVRPVGLDTDGFVQVPPLKRPNLTAWYRLGPTPGQLGPAVILGHVNTKAGPAVFARLPTLAKGDAVEVDRADGSVAAFTVDRVEWVRKRSFPTARVYGNIRTAGLRLITCGGTFDPKAGSYNDNIIVYATLSGSR
jgi:sortase (surface protein transpeptidase)